MNKSDRDASIPRNVQLYAEDSNDQLISLKSDLSGQLNVNLTLGDIVAVVSGDVKTSVSGNIISVASGVYLASGIFFVTLASGAATTIGNVGVLSGQISVQSGLIGVSSGEVHILSGQLISKVSGEAVKVSGQIVSVASGAEIIWRTTNLSGIVLASGAFIRQTTSELSGQEIIWRGIQVSGAVIVSGIVGISGSIGVLSGRVSVSSGEVHIISGSIGAQVSGAIIISGTVTTQKNATRYIIFSGYATTDLLVYSGIDFTQGEKMLIGLTCLTQGSGIRYTIRGGILSGILRYSMTSGSFTSGQVIAETITDPYEWIDVGIASLQSGFSGTVTVGVVVK